LLLIDEVKKLCRLPDNLQSLSDLESLKLFRQQSLPSLSKETAA